MFSPYEPSFYSGRKEDTLRTKHFFFQSHANIRPDQSLLTSFLVNEQNVSARRHPSANPKTCVSVGVRECVCVCVCNERMCVCVPSFLSLGLLLLLLHGLVLLQSPLCHQRLQLGVAPSQPGPDSV